MAEEPHRRRKEEVMKRRALLSVADKTGLVEFAKGLDRLGFELLSTGGTAKSLREAGLPVTPVEEVTGFPEMLDGRVKTLHPKVHGGILGRRADPAHRAAMEKAGIAPIDLVCVVFYRFEDTVAKPGVTREEAVEQIDIGGPSMVRSAAKNHEDVWVVTDPAQYGEVLAGIEGGVDGGEFRRRLAREAFARTSAYDAAIAAWFSRRDTGAAFPESWPPRLVKVLDLRYGENPHQKAAFYRETAPGEACVARATIRTDKKALSYNNLMDLDAAFELVKEFDGPAAVVVKHTNPCGVALGADLREAYRRAHECDPVSAFGCILALNRTVDATTADEIARPDKFVEAMVAPGFEPEALEILRTRTKWGKSLRILETGPIGERTPGFAVRQLVGGLLVQERDQRIFDPAVEGGFVVVTKRAPTEAEAKELRFAFAVVKHVKSNAIVLTKDLAAVGVGAGQMSRVESAEIAVKRAGERAKGSVCASDAFFPFPDGLAVVAKAGATAVIQPGGSVRDEAVIAEADRRGLAMVFTKTRHFRH
jgi:phosphoribosylaminoimidazolecarboxamide formyltransferase/IMP cyclohydrolase